MISKFKNKVFSAALILIGTAAAVFILETFLQFNDYRKHQFAFKESKQLSFQISPFLQIEPRENPEDHINKDLFRGDAVDLSADTFRIFTLGGSTTFSLKLPYEETYPKKLETKLRNSYPGTNIQIQNAACDWYSTQHSIIRFLFRVRLYKPDVIIVMHGINDLLRSFAPEAYTRPGDDFQPDYSHYLGALADIGRDADPYFPFQTLILPQKISELKSAVAEKMQPAPPTQGWRPDDEAAAVSYFKSLPIFEKNLRTLIEIAKLYSVKVVLLTQPNIYRSDLNPKELESLYFASWHMRDKNNRYPDVASLEKGMRLYNDVILKVARETNTPAVDLEPAIPKTSGYFFDDVHPKEPAAEIEAELIHNKLIELQFINEWKARLQTADEIA